MRRIILERAVRQPQTLLLLCIFSIYLSGCEKDHAIDLQASNASDRQQPTDVRVMSWNVKANSIFPPNGVRQESFARIVRAIDPDVIALQEVLRRELVAELTQLMNEYIPLENGGSWHVHGVSDNALVSRYPMRWRGGERAVPYPLPQFGLPDFYLGFASVLVDLPERFGATDLLLVATHKKSGGDMEDVRQRQIHADTIVRWMRDIRQMLAKDFAEALRFGTQGMVDDMAANHGGPWGFPLNEIHITVHLWACELDHSVPPAMGNYLSDMVPDCKATHVAQAGHLWILIHLNEVLNAIAVDNQGANQPTSL